MSDKLIPITVWLAGRSYRIRIKPEDEQFVRQSVKIADNKITQYRNDYAGKDNQDFMAMCLLSYAIDSANVAINDPFFQEELKKMTNKIDSVLNK